MNSLKNLFTAICMILAPAVLLASGSCGDSPGTDISVKENAKNIAGIFEDTVVVVTGKTYSYTVDTPEGEGLVSTGIRARELPLQVKAENGNKQQYRVLSGDGSTKNQELLESGDRLIVEAEEGKARKTYFIKVQQMALSGRLDLEQSEVTVGTDRELTLNFTAGQRSPDATVRLFLPEGIKATVQNTTVNVIGRGAVKLEDLDTQSIGHVGTNYSYSKVGEVEISDSPDGGSVLTFRHLDLRPYNGVDLKVVIGNVMLTEVGTYPFKATYTTSEPEILTSAGTGPETASLKAVRTISDFGRVVDKRLQYKASDVNHARVDFRWTPGDEGSEIQLMQSTDKGQGWTRSQAANVDAENGTATVSGLKPNQLYTFRLAVENGEKFSNSVRFYSGKMDIKKFGVTGSGHGDDTQKINEAIDYLHEMGGGTLLFSEGVYNVRTVHLKSNVWLYVDQGATIKALKGADAPRPTWFSDKKYRSGLSPTDTGPYENPENWLTKQDVGHTYFRNTMFFGERVDNVKIIGNGRITGDGNLVTTDRVMAKDPDNRADKMFTFKLSTNIEIGGLPRGQDLWYDPDKDEPYYISEDGSKDFKVNNMLQIDQGGHFVLLATGSNNVNVHDTYFAGHSEDNARDIYDFMGTSNVTVTNIYSKVSSDDIVKLGSDCSLGYTRPAQNFKIRNVIGDTNCNLFQIGSETADDITDVHVDNIYVLGANKAGFSISTNDGALVKNIHLNCGHTGRIHSRSKMKRTGAPFFVSISNRGRILGAEVDRYQFEDNGRQRDELLVKNVNIGKVENIILNNVDVSEVYEGSSYGDDKRWESYDGSQDKATPIVAGYALPGPDNVEGGLDFRLPDGRHTGYIKNIVFNDVHVLVKGGNPASDTTRVPPELGVGQYNVRNLKIQPSYGLWVRHVKNLTVSRSTFNFEKRDNRYAIFLDDVEGAQITDVKMVRAANNDHVIKLKNSPDVSLENVVYYRNEWRNAPTELPPVHHTDGEGFARFPVE